MSRASVLSLEEKIKINGGSSGYALDFIKTPNNRGRRRGSQQSKTPRDAYGRPKRNRSKSSGGDTSNKSEKGDPIVRTFNRNQNSTIATNIATPAYIRQCAVQSNEDAPSTISKTPYNPYKAKSNSIPPSSAKFARNQKQDRSATHIVCSISENLARETCITTMDATSPTTIEVHKMANGQTYVETLSYLEMMSPHEVLLNEGRRNSQLCRKVVNLFNAAKKTDDSDINFDDDLSLDDENTAMSDITNTLRRKGKSDPREKSRRKHCKTKHSDKFKTPSRRHPSTATSSTGSKKGECDIQTIVKFLPRSYFDQTRGAELLERVALDTSYDPSIINEYIVLSSSYSLVSYLQSCLGSNFNRNSLKIVMNWGGKYRMAIDRTTISHLELLANAQTGKNKNSLIGTIDCTKTAVGSRLLRSNLMSPPTGIATINARLDLVDCFLEDEGFFYEVLEQLQALPDVDKMISHISMSPNQQRLTKSKRGGRPRRVTPRMASRGISALVCIKSTLSVIPNFARVLEIQLKSLEQTHTTQDGGRDNSAVRASPTSDDISGNIYIQPSKKQKGSGLKNDAGDDDSNISEVLDEDDNNNYDATRSTKESSSIPQVSDSVSSHVKGDTKSMITNASGSLLIGLGGSGEGGSAGQSSEVNPNSSNHQLLRAILMIMKLPALQEILDAVLNIFTESTMYSRNSHAMRHQECFALKPNTDGMMDVLRKAFLANVDDIYKLADEYSQSYGFTVAVKETTARGYYLSIPVTQVGGDLPNIFIQPVKSGKYYNCTSEEVLSLNSRAQENVQDLLLMTHERIQECIEGARQKFDALASLSDAIALIDMCHCFADNVVSSRQPWCRPIVTDCCNSGGISAEEPKNGIIGSGAIAIRNGRFGIDVSKNGLVVSDDGDTKCDYIPNDTYASAFQNFTVITGINGSGKSTYLKQIAITVILAHCGCYVPAEEAYIPVRDRICTRIGTTDDQEHNISTFMQEMKDTAFICKNATDKSLILIDELGRATSNEDGVAIAWAIGEFLLVKRAMTFFVTHYPQLCRMADIYPNVQNQHLGTISNETTEEILYTHKIMPGPCQMSADYGVDMASTCGWEQDVVQLAKRVRSEVESKLPDGLLCQQISNEASVDMIAVRNKAESILNNLAKHLVALKASENRLDKAARRSYLQDLREQFVENDDHNVVHMIKSLLLEDNETVSHKLPLRPEGLLSLRTSQVCSNDNVTQNHLVSDANIYQVGGKSLDGSSKGMTSDLLMELTEKEATIDNVSDFGNHVMKSFLAIPDSNTPMHQSSHERMARSHEIIEMESKESALQTPCIQVTNTHGLNRSSTKNASSSYKHIQEVIDIDDDSRSSGSSSSSSSDSDTDSSISCSSSECSGSSSSMSSNSTFDAEDCHKSTNDTTHFQLIKKYMEEI